MERKKRKQRRKKGKTAERKGGKRMKGEKENATQCFLLFLPIVTA